jgi:dolichyl-phosphate-mannose--protein O-mannosyl transferase
MFEYHFFPNLAVIVLCDVVLIRAIWNRLVAAHELVTARFALAGYLVVVAGLFAFFYPVLAGTQVSWAAWHARMWPDVLGIPGTSWIIPHR